jgi:putative CocE/NonD family hydrolase
MGFSSFYLTMRDGVKIACDLRLPKALGEGRKIPTIVHQTRYLRSIQLRLPYRWFTRGKPLDHTGLYRERRRLFLDNGYAWLDVDVRGSGASFGVWLSPWSVFEIRDGGEIVDWIVSQPWSDGRVGAMGISYDGTAAEMLLLSRHPAVRAVAPRFACFDTYADVAFPGGIPATWFTRRWQEVNSALDRNAPHQVEGRWAVLFVTGVNPVQEDRDRSLLRDAIREHRDNVDLNAEAESLTFRDDVSPADTAHKGEMELEALPVDPSGTVGSLGVFSPHSYAGDIEASGAAIYSYAGWLDGAYAHAAVKRFLAIRTEGSRLILGPWNHCGGWNTNQLHGPKRTEFDHNAELLRFFDCTLKGKENELSRAKPVRYFTTVEEKWKEADIWPPPGTETRTCFLAPDNRLSLEPPTETDGADEYRVDYSAKTGEKSRWKTQIQADKPVRYGNRKGEDKRLLTYDSAPLEEDTEVTGHPIVTLYVVSTAEDGTVLVYLEDVAPNGRVAYVTEGGLRAIHRKLSDKTPPYPHVVPYRTFHREDAMPLIPGEVAELTFDLQPISYLFMKGHTIRVALAGADASLFTPPPGDPPTLRICRNSTHPSRIELPVMPR